MYIYIYDVNPCFDHSPVPKNKAKPTKGRIEQRRVGCSVGLRDDAVVLSQLCKMVSNPIGLIGQLPLVN